MEYKNMIFNLASSSILLSYVILYIHSIPCFAATAVKTNETDLQALLAIKNQGDHFKSLSSWNDSLHFCNWHGITCGLRHERVTVLNISSLGLVGSLSPYIGNLSFLKELNIQDNNFQGPIPMEIGKLFRLQYLRFGNNSFQGKLPTNLTHCSELQVIDLSRNYNLEGTIPVELGSLSNLHSLVLSWNSFSGEIPPSLGNLSSLSVFQLSRNNLHGRIPVELGQLSTLNSFQISSNNLSGTVPVKLYNISSIQIFSITNNSLVGNFPPDLGLTLPNLNLFLADLNQFSGSIPASLANASGLVKISVGDNALTGPIPLNLGSLRDLQTLHFGHNPIGTNKSDDTSFISSLTNCSSLQILSLSRIQIGGVLPNTIGNFSTTLTNIFLNDNYISGNIPPEIGNLVKLDYLTIDTNLLTGRIPDSIGKLTNLQELYFYTNRISGEIPSSIGNITSLRRLVLEDNMLEGPIPVSLGNCSDLEGLHLAWNRLNGTIPEQIMSLSSLSIGLILYQNQLTGPLPSQVGTLKQLVTLAISDNKLSGEIPSTLGSCLMLQELGMEGNFFEGPIPPSLGQLKNIETLDLSRNKLSGQIPPSLGQLRTINQLNLSFNMLEGEVPNEGVFTNVSKFSVLGNKKLCGGVEELQFHDCPKKQRKLRTRSVIIILATTIPALSIVLLIVCVYAICQIRTRKQRQPSSSGSTEENKYPQISFADLQISTNGFSSENLIGEGRFGIVYKGVFRSGEQIVAVKVLKLQEHGANKSFLAECEALKNIRHRNLVKIITVCSSIDFKGDNFKALVYEFMPNGSLDNWLHSNSSEQNDTKNLSLIQRINIAIDVASALDYLHHNCERPVIHCDLKPSNILLDDELCAHVGDFGLARFLSATKGESSHMKSSTSNGIRGTIGYVAPEYGMLGEVSAHGDVYSYGILLLEIFTGKRPTDSMFSANVSLHSYVKMGLPQVMKIVDPKMFVREEDIGSDNTNQYREETVVGIAKVLGSILQIGVLCSAEMPKERMEIPIVLHELHKFKGLLLPLGREAGERKDRNK